MVNAYRSIPQLLALNKALAIVEDENIARGLREIRDDIEKTLHDAGMSHLIRREDDR